MDALIYWISLLAKLLVFLFLLRCVSDCEFSSMVHAHDAIVQLYVMHIIL